MDLQNSQKQFSVQKKHVSFLVKQHQEVCAAVAKGVQVYEGSSRKALVNHLSTFMLTFLSFRRRVVLGLIEQAHTSSGRNLFGTTANLASSTSLAAAQHSDGKLSEAQLRQVLQGIETNIATLTGQYDPREENDPASDTYSPLKPKSLGPIGIKLAPDPLTLQEYDQIIAELLGIPLPRYMCKCGEGDCCSGLAQLQGQVETILFHISEHFALEESLMVVAPEPPKPLASSISLKDLQQTLFKELWEGKPPAESSADDTVNTTEVGEGTVSPTKSLRRQLEGPPIHVVEEVNDLMHKQRVEQVSHYLEILNEKAVKRKKMIRGLMNLWQSAKMVIEDHNKISKFVSAAEIEQKRLLAMPVEDILAQTRSMQTQLVREMEEKSSTKLSQLSQRINLLRHGIASQSIPDEDLAVTATLREVSALENALLQANSDAMRLAARIIKQLSDKKAGAGVTL